MNWIINWNVVLNNKTLSQYGFKLNDKIELTYSKEDYCFYIKKTTLGENKLRCHSEDGLSMWTGAKHIVEKICGKNNKPIERIYFDIVQDEYDKQNDTIKCIIDESYEHAE